jgi:hypothetical protein
MIKPERFSALIVANLPVSSEMMRVQLRPFLKLGPIESVIAPTEFE